MSGYLQAEPLLRSLVIVIKTWASERGINDRSQGPGAQGAQEPRCRREESSKRRVTEWEESQ